jgi:hypothetical protein
MEVLFVVAVGIAALIHSSIVAIAFFLLGNLLFLTMILDQRSRFNGGRITSIFIFLLLIAEIVWKVKEEKKIITSTQDHSVFIKEIAFYESLGFSLNYNKDDLKNGQQKLNNNPNYEFTITYNKWLSFMLEIFFGIMILMLIWLMTKQYNKFLYLTNPDNHQRIKDFLHLSKEENDESDQEEENKNESSNIGMKKVITQQ